ncbi:hypothetical protein PF010_g10407 [Phytophthora fragariae]|uniref:OTU domain-containing protein n=1 Tax=Phytophthora fragariae TaxID=53985 RepID=A0A6G0L9M3_9STRA|nr:hypothetical protein PF010_g10407 [Phytophthora fragariae]KAE9245313.1 hypothetical protein PF004_g5293 [Phytophthora fragariae]
MQARNPGPSRSTRHPTARPGANDPEAQQDQPGANRSDTSPPSRAPTTKSIVSIVARRYQETLDAYRALAADSDSDSDDDDDNTGADTASDPTVHDAGALPLAGNGPAQEAMCTSEGDTHQDGESSPTRPSQSPVQDAGQVVVEMRDTADSGEAMNDSRLEESMPLSAVPSGEPPHHPMEDKSRSRSVDADFDVDMCETPLPSHAAGHRISTTSADVERHDHILGAEAHSPHSGAASSQEPFWNRASPASTRPMCTDEVVAESNHSSNHEVGDEGFVLEKVVPPSQANNLDYRAWIGSLNGVPVSVPANGQCLFLAFYATTTNTQAAKLTLRSATVAAADLVKQRVLDIVLANLRYDVKLHLILPKEELQRIYPGEMPPKSVEAAAATLFAHYTTMRSVSVATPVPQAFWEGPTVLRAMAVYLREPIYVWDIGADDKSYVQQYSYKAFEMDNGDRHETGVVTAVPGDKIRDFLEACFHQQVLPAMLLLNHTEGHFYGVQHGEIFHEWHAQRGPEMRERLDTVHRLIGLPVLPSAGYEPDSVAAEAEIAHRQTNFLRKCNVPMLIRMWMYIGAYTNGCSAPLIQN